MRQRHYRARVWLNKEEYNTFCKMVSSSKLSKEAFLRKLITDKKVVQSPPIEYNDLLRKTSELINMLSAIGYKDNSYNDNEWRLARTKICELLISLQGAVEGIY